MALTKVRGSGLDSSQEGAITFNEGSASVDFRVESNNNANMFFVDGTNDKVGINTNAPNNTLDLVASASGYAARITNNNDSSEGLLIRTSDNDSGQFILDLQTSSSSTGTDYASKVVVDKLGRLLVGTTGEPSNTAAGVQLSNPTITAPRISVGATTSEITMLSFINSNGVVGQIKTQTTSTSYVTSSDYRLKENVVTDWDATSRLKQLKPSRFNFKTSKDTTVDGFLAHEVSSIVPEAISGKKDAVDKDGNIDPQGIDQSKLVPLLTKSLQEALARIDTLEAKVTALESK